jgi:hypothetical protein
MSEDQAPSTTDLMNAIVALHDFTESGFASLTASNAQLGIRIDSLDIKVDRFRHDMNRRFDTVDDRFDRVDQRFDRFDSGVERLERNPAP